MILEFVLLAIPHLHIYTHAPPTHPPTHAHTPPLLAVPHLQHTLNSSGPVGSGAHPILLNPSGPVEGGAHPILVNPSGPVESGVELLTG